MAVTDDGWTLADARWPEVDVASVAFAYDPPTDTLYADLFGRPLPAVTEPLAASDDIVSLRVALEGDEVVGIEIEGYLRLALPRFPSWSDLAPLAGVPTDALPSIRASGPAPRRDVVVTRFIAEVKAFWTADVTVERPALAR
jgi:hypothetical protein